METLKGKLVIILQKHGMKRGQFACADAILAAVLECVPEEKTSYEPDAPYHDVDIYYWWNACREEMLKNLE